MGGHEFKSRSITSATSNKFSDVRLQFSVTRLDKISRLSYGFFPLSILKFGYNLAHFLAFFCSGNFLVALGYFLVKSSGHTVFKEEAKIVKDFSLLLIRTQFRETTHLSNLTELKAAKPDLKSRTEANWEQKQKCFQVRSCNPSEAIPFEYLESFKVLEKNSLFLEIIRIIDWTQMNH